MRAFEVRENAHPSKITLSLNAPIPIPGPDEVLVDVYSAGLNFFDVRCSLAVINLYVSYHTQILQAQGKYQVKPPFPFVLGAEFAGRIAPGSPIPEGCTYNVGDRVFGSVQGCYADKVVSNWKQLLPLPKGMTFDDGAGPCCVRFVYNE